MAKSKLQLVAKSGSALPFPRLGFGEHFRFAEHPFQAILLFLSFSLDFSFGPRQLLILVFNHKSLKAQWVLKAEWVLIVILNVFFG